MTHRRCLISGIAGSPVNDAPVAVDSPLFTSEDTAVSSGVGATDIDGDTLTYSIVVGPAHGALPVFNTTTGGYTYQPTANYNGGDSFTFKANDGTVTPTSPRSPSR